VTIDDLGDGLILRRARPDDAEKLSVFNGEIHRSHDATEPARSIAAWTRDLAIGAHPTFKIDDFTIVEDTRGGSIVSSLNLISQTWLYDGIAFDVGMIELVGTHPNFRSRGLVRRQFEVVHRWSAERGQLAQVISGIPWYYRQFGYEYAIDEGGGRGGIRSRIPTLKDGETDTFRVRSATVDDAPFIAYVYDAARQRYLVSCARDEAMWRHEIGGRSVPSTVRAEMCVVESATGDHVGFLAHPARLWGNTLEVRAYELKAGVSWLAVTPSVLRYLAATGTEYGAQSTPDFFDGFTFMLGTDHPVYRAIPSLLQTTVTSGTWYVRIPDLASFVHRIAPVLESRLAASEAIGFTGELKLNFYRDGLWLVFEMGQLRSAEVWPRPERYQSSASFPDRTFLQLLFGRRSFAEIRHAFPDCYARDNQAQVLLNILFPARPSLIWQIS
jgi:hypothetical protein